MRPTDFARASLLPALLLVAACGGAQQTPPPVEEPVVEAKPKAPPPPPPVCVRAGEEMSLVGMVEADAEAARFCVSDGADSNLCYAVDLQTKKYSELAEPPRGQSPVLDPDPARLETTAKEVKVCVGDDCKTFKPKVPRGNENPIDASVNAAGTRAAVLMGDAEKGKGTVELWDVTKGKRIGVPIKYAKGDYKCGEARMLGDTLYVSASVCSGPAARAWLFTAKAKKLAEVGGKEFGTYGTVPLQVGDTTWAFLDENASAIAIQDVKTGEVVKTIDISALWGGGDGEEPGPMGNPGESALVRGDGNNLIVVTGGPAPGSIGIVDVEAGLLAGTITALACAPAEGGGGDDDGGAEDDATADEVE